MAHTVHEYGQNEKQAGIVIYARWEQEPIPAFACMLLHSYVSIASVPSRGLVFQDVVCYRYIC